MKLIRKRSLLKLTQGLIAAIAIPVAAFAQGYPDKPVQLTVPFGAGGGTDTLMRTMQPYIERELAADLVVLNAPGAGSITGSRSVVGKSTDGYAALVNHVTLLTNMAVGKADFGLDDFVIAASATSTPLVVVVPANSEVSDLDGLKAALQGDGPVIAGVNIGAVNHFAMLMLDDQLDAGGFRYVQTGGGAKTVAALLGSQIAVGVLSGAEAMPLHEAGEVQVIAALSADRIPYLADVPTAVEQGADIDFSIEHTWYFPSGTSAEAVATFAAALERALADKDLAAELEGRGITPTYYGPDVAPERVAGMLETLTSAAELIKK